MYFDSAQHKQRGFAHVLILFLAVALIGGAYYFGTKKSSLQDTVSKQNPLVYSSPQPSGNKSLPDTKPNNSDETLNWKTYTNNGSKFSFKYPGYFESLKDNLPQTANPNVGGSVQDKLDLAPSDKYNPRLQIYMNPRFGGTCLEDVLYSMSLENKQIDFTKKYQDQVFQPCQNDPVKRLGGILKLNDNLSLLFSFSYDTRDNPYNYEKDFDQILSTFRFTQ